MRSTNACTAPCANTSLALLSSAGTELVFAGNTEFPSGVPAGFARVSPDSPSSLNSSGEVIFQVVCAGNVGTANGICGWTRDSGPFPLVVPGTELEVSPGVFRRVQEAYPAGQYAPGTPSFAINDSGQFAFQANFYGGSSGIFTGSFNDFLRGYFPCPVVITPPASQSANEGSTVILAVAADGLGDLAYEWRRNTQPVTDDARVSGATTNTLRIGDITSGDAGSYDVVITNTCGSAISEAALLTVTPVCGTADFNGDGDIGTDADIEAFFACLSGNCCAECFPGGADFNGDGDVGTDADIESFFRVLSGGSC